MIKQVATWLILFSVSLAMVLTNSRNAVVALVLGSLGMVSGVIFKKFNILKHNLFIVGAACSAFLLAFYIIYPIAPLSSFLDTLIQFASDDDRLRIWKFGISVATDNFMFGFGPNGFSNYVSLLSPFDRPINHVHSMPLQLWISYGLMATVLLLLYVFSWLIRAMRLGIFRDCWFTRAWFVSFLLLVIFHVTDLPYLDARINLFGWILFSGIVSYAESSGFRSTGP